MGITAYPNGVSSFGIPLLGGAVLPSTQGNVFHVRPRTGSNGNDGSSPGKAFKTLAYAHGKATANQNDIILLYAESNTAGSTTDYQSSTLVWSKDLVHLIGVNAGPAVSQRSRIAQLSTAIGVSPLVNVTANDCMFLGIEFYHGVADATSLICLTVAGQRNAFTGCHIAGIGHATMVTAGAASLSLPGSENVFRNCVIGLDSIARDNSTYGEIYFPASAEASRNKFEDCLIQGFVSNAGYVHVTVADATAIDRWTWFKHCLFLVESANDAVGQTSVMSIPAMTQGYILLDDSSVSLPTGTPTFDSNARGRIRNNRVAAAAAGAGGLFTAK